MEREVADLECQIEATRARCTCTYEPCVRKGRCCDCIAYHLKYDELPGCVFPAEVEKDYDRSFACFVSVHNAGGGGKN